MSREQKPSALITGGGTGIGRAIAEKFLKNGYRVVLIGRRAQPLQEMARRLPEDVLAAPCDITKPDDVRKIFAFLKSDETFGLSLKVLVNNAGIFERKSFQESDDVFWSKMFETNLLGSVRITRACLPLLKPNKGVIVNVSSTLGMRPSAETTAYSALKAAMNNWTQGLALETAPFGVRVNCVCPGIVDTPIHGFHESSEEDKLKSLGSLQPLGRIGKPDDIAHAVWALTGPGSEWTTGAVLAVDGGISLT